MSQQLQTVDSDVPLTIHARSGRTYYADFTALLPTGVTITEAEVDADSADLTVGDALPNSDVFTNRRNQTVAVGKGVTFTMSGGVTGSTYTVTVGVTLSDGGTDAMDITVNVAGREAA